jgi:hypothetical protein
VPPAPDPRVRPNLPYFLAMGAWVASAREAKGPWVRGWELERELELPIRVEREEYELWGEAFGVLSFEPSLSLWAVKTRMPADLCLSEGVTGEVTEMAEGEPKMVGRDGCWGRDSVSIGEVRPDASTDLDEEWAEWGM